jgi:queuine tRNA-ribosyltransferase
MMISPLVGPSIPSSEPFFRFELLHQSSKSRARVGRIHTPHGVVDTPGFVPVGTNGALKGMTNEQAADAGVQLMFCNTYHLLVHPGPEVVRSAGGLHSYMKRQAPLITDSGGFQVFSLAHPTADDGPELKQRSKTKRKTNNMGSVLGVSEEGVRFRSYYDASEILLTPESSVDTQKALGADIIIPLDELPPYGIGRERLKESVALSHRWMARSLER